MSSSQFSHNPLRPYYVPPAPADIDLPAPPPPPVYRSAPAAPSSASSLFADLNDYSADFLETPSVSESIKNFANQALLSYTSVLISQPFEVAKTVLQCQYVPKKEPQLEKQKKRMEEEFGENFGELSEEESDDEVRYFQSSADSPEDSPSLRPQKRGMKKMTDRAGYVLEDQKDADIPRPDYQIKLVREGAVGEALKCLWQKEGAWGIWKGTNSTFIYTIATSTLESWTTSLFSAILSIPDAGVTDIADSTHPLASLAVAVTASALTAILLSPLDIIRTKLIVTPSSSKPRNLVPSLRALPSYLIPSSLILPTTLHAVLPSLMNLGAPYFLKTKLLLDPISNSTSYSFFSFIASTAELFVRLPLETILRRAQVAEAKPERTIVPVGRYAGVAGTAWVLLKEEESGKWGIEGLYRGWRVGAWGNVGVLGLGFIGVQGAQAGEF